MDKERENIEYLRAEIEHFRTEVEYLLRLERVLKLVLLYLILAKK